MSEIDPVTREPIVLLLRRPSPRSLRDVTKSWPSGGWLDWRIWGPLKPAWALRPGVPARSMVVALALIPVALAVSSRAGEPFSIPVSVGYIALVAVCIGLEGSNTRDYVTPTRLVRRYGIFGRGRREIPLGAIERVEFDYSGLWPSGERLNMGDLRISLPHEIITIANVPDPEAAAQTILDLKGKAPAASETPAAT
jgi:hypothetical protein